MAAAATGIPNRFDKEDTSYPPSSSNSDTSDPLLPGSGSTPSDRPAHTSWRTASQRHTSIMDAAKSSSHSLLFAARSLLFSRPLTRYLVLLLFVLGPAYWLLVPTYRPMYPGRPHSQHPPPSPESVALWNSRAEEVKAAFVHAYRGYEQFAFPADELLPMDGLEGKTDNFNGWAVTMVDSLDTMLMMGLTAEFERGVEVVAKLDFRNHKKYIPFFETTIRYFGGLLSAYALSPSHTILLTKAEELGSVLLPIFNSTSGLPLYAINPSTGEMVSNYAAPLAEAGSCQMEYKFLAHLTGNKKYFQEVEKVVDHFQKGQDKKTDLLATMWSLQNGTPFEAHYSIGALADSAYEYLLKGYLLSGKVEKKTLNMYLRATRGIINHLLYISPNRQLLYVTDIYHSTTTSPSHTLEELSCFLPGLFALGAHLLPEDVLSAYDRELHMWVAKGLATTCYLTFADSDTGLGPDEAWFEPNGVRKWVDVLRVWERSGRPGGQTPPGATGDQKPEKDPKKKDYRLQKASYLLRPETVESLFILYRVTGDEKWREMGYDIFKAIEKHAKTKIGYASVMYVDHIPTQKINSMPSYFLAETLKYLYLLFIDGDGGIALDKYVFNTEAHPFPIFEWTRAEKKAFGIPT